MRPPVHVVPDQSATAMPVPGLEKVKFQKIEQKVEELPAQLNFGRKKLSVN